jgi:hypothetical protein
MYVLETNPSIVAIASTTLSSTSAELFKKISFDITVRTLLYMKVLAGSHWLPSCSAIMYVLSARDKHIVLVIV